VRKHLSAGIYDCKGVFQGLEKTSKVIICEGEQNGKWELAW
jgi:hypothetical protein